MKATPLDLVVLAAFPPELASFRNLFGDSMLGGVGRWTVAARAVGIGLADAAVGTAKCLADLRPRAALLVGTVGAYPGSGLAIDEVVVARRVRLVDPSAIDGRSQFPDAMCVSIDADASMAQSFAQTTEASLVDVATTLAITVDGTLANRIRTATGARVEHLEAHAFAVASVRLGVPFAAVLGIANEVGERAREQWRTHHATAAARAGDAVVQWLLGDGLRAVIFG